MPQSEKLVVNIIGQAGAGKSSSAARLQQLFNAEIFRPSDVIRRYAKQHNVPLTHRADYVNCQQAMLKADPAAIIRPVMDNPNRLILIDGLRVPAHADHFKQALGMRTIALDASPEIRYRNITAATEWRQYRNESHINSPAALIADEAADNFNTNPHEPNVEAIMRAADHTILINESTPEPLIHLEQALVISRWLHQTIN